MQDLPPGGRRNGDAEFRVVPGNVGGPGFRRLLFSTDLLITLGERVSAVYQGCSRTGA
jgi:hypothetical protein